MYYIAMRTRELRAQYLIKSGGNNLPSYQRFKKKIVQEVKSPLNELRLRTFHLFLNF